MAQFLNARLLVDYLGVVVRVCEGAETEPVELVGRGNVKFLYDGGDSCKVENLNSHM